MSRTKSVTVRDRVVWAWDNSIDIVLALMSEEAGSDLDTAIVDEWRVWASVGDLGVELDVSDESTSAALHAVLARVRRRIVAHGGFGSADLRGWTVLDDRPVSGGELRGGSLCVAAVTDAVDALDELIDGRFPNDPEQGYWIVGSPDGRQTHVRA